MKGKNSVVYNGTFSENDMEALNWRPFVGALGSGVIFPVTIHYSQRSFRIVSVMFAFPPVRRPRVCRDLRFLQLQQQNGFFPGDNDSPIASSG